jgi:hypothetical protein
MLLCALWADNATAQACVKKTSNTGAVSCANSGAACKPTTDGSNASSGICRTQGSVADGDSSCECVDNKKVPPPVGYQLAVAISPGSSNSTLPGGTIMLSVSATPVGTGTSGPINVACGVPSGMTCAGLALASVPSSGTTKVTVSGDVASGTYNVTVTATDSTGQPPVNFAATLPITIGIPAVRVGSPIAHPTFVNIYWDDSWDSDNPGSTVATVNAVTAAILASSYFSGLTEYGVGKPSFGGGFIPPPLACEKAPSPTVGFWDPNGPSISGFIFCMTHYHVVPTGDNVIYNVILPSKTTEVDGSFKTFCAGGGPVAWHFHNLPQNTPSPLPIDKFFELLLNTHDGPIYTIESTSPTCGSFFANLGHEMVESASDPYGSFIDAVLSGGGGEIGDICQDLGVPTTPVFGLPQIPGIALEQYWSALQNRCIVGFNSTTMPSGSITPAPPNPTLSMSGQGLDTHFLLSGAGFGLPPPGSTIGSLPYLSIANVTRGWSLGPEPTDAALSLNIAAWSDAAVLVNGLNVRSDQLNVAFPPATPPSLTVPVFNLQLVAGDTIQATLCNPSSGLCTVASANAPVQPGAHVKVFVGNAPSVNTSVTILLDGTPINVVSESSSWLPISAGGHTFTGRDDGTGHTIRRYSGACDAMGQFSATDGDNIACRIVNFADAECAAGTHCCTPATSSGGCSTECVSTATTCKLLCTEATQKCCGGPQSDGSCDVPCIPRNSKCL